MQDHPYTESDSGPEDFIFPLNGYLAPCTKLSALDNPLSETHGLSKLSPKAVKQGETTARQGMKRKKKKMLLSLRSKEEKENWAVAVCRFVAGGA